uniref:DUF1919 domain-containing protein n=1 Tax=Lactococcus lactis TaxID=1358 RepID=A0A3Q9TDB0_9LACT|nr:DUF1919 domain-containing protein [Lactococcus lactis]
MLSFFYKIKNAYIYKTSSFRKNKLISTDFSIISNNCWGGMVYKSYNLPYLSPTVGCFFMAHDYIKFLSNIQEYMSKDLSFISVNESKWKEYFENDIDYPIGKLDDIEIFFVHYYSQKEVLEKWNRRRDRINWENLVIKVSEQNGFSKEHLDTFNSLNFQKKIAFIGNDYSVGKNVLRVTNLENGKKDIDINEEPRIGKKIIDFLNER